MELKKALKYLVDNEPSLVERDALILGVAYTPEDLDGDFYIIQLSLDETAMAEEGIYYFNAKLEGGYLGSSEGVEDYLGESDVETLIAQFPDFATDIQYHVYELEYHPFGYESAFALKTIFTDLPDPDECDTVTFKAAAIAIIAKVNSQEAA